jgi:hypothetical protein
MGKPCSTYGRDEAYVQDLGVKIEAEKPLSYFEKKINVYRKMA